MTLHEPPEPSPESTPRDVRRVGRRLQWITVAWNSLEVFVTIALGIAAGSLALVAFGLDSLVEVFASLVVVWHLGGRGTDDGTGTAAVEGDRDRRALRLVGAAFAVLAVYLAVASGRTLWLRSRPESSPLGIAYLTITAGVMFGLAALKRRVGHELASEPFLAEASMTFLDGWLATSILGALVVNTGFGWWWADPVAALLVAVASAREARENWTEAGS